MSVPSLRIRENSDGGRLAQFKGRELLTPREREVLAEVVAGASNKAVGRKLGVSPRTIEVHRAHIMDKLGAKNAADLVRIALGQGPQRERAAGAGV